MLWRQNDECYSVHRINASRKCGDGLLLQPILGNIKLNVHALAATDPVVLHRVYLIGPVNLRMVKKFLCIVCDFEEPLVEIPVRDRGRAALTEAIYHLFVSQHSLTGRAPIYWGVGTICQSALVELEEKPLIPSVVLWGAGNDFSVPIVDCSHTAELTPHVLHIFCCPPKGMDSTLDGRVLSIQPECVKAHWVKHIVTLHAAEARMSIRWTHRIPVTDMEVTRGVRVHRQLIPLRARVVVVDLVGAALEPALLPFGINSIVVISLLCRSDNCHS